jgi:hypothetical protein
MRKAALPKASALRKAIPGGVARYCPSGTVK